MSSDHFLSGKKIIVVGAGIAGLSFSIALRKLWREGLGAQNIDSPASRVTIVIYERDSEEIRLGRGGYSLSLRADASSGGVQALHRLGVLEPVLRVRVNDDPADSGGFVIWDRDWNEFVKFRGEALDPDSKTKMRSIRVNRSKLTRVLADKVSTEDEIHWGLACVGVKQGANGKVGVSLSNGSTDECDILIAADGASSRVRAFLRPEDKLSFAGVVCISGYARFEAEIPPPVNHDWGVVLGGGSTGLFVSPHDAHHAIWSISYPAPNPREPMRPPLTTSQTNSLLQEAFARGNQFTEPFQSMVHATDPSTLMLFNAMDRPPFPHTNETSPSTRSSQPHAGSANIIFIGDSNHAVSPFAGNGANMALMDGWDLAKQLVTANSVSEALSAYDAISMPRATATLRFSRRSIDLAHAQGLKLLCYTIVLRLFKLCTAAANRFSALKSTVLSFVRSSADQ